MTDNIAAMIVTAFSVAVTAVFCKWFDVDFDRALLVGLVYFKVRREMREED